MKKNPRELKMNEIMDFAGWEVIKVPGGWIYKYDKAEDRANADIKLQFVPDTEMDKDGVVDKLMDISTKLVKMFSFSELPDELYDSFDEASEEMKSLIDDLENN